MRRRKRQQAARLVAVLAPMHIYDGTDPRNGGKSVSTTAAAPPAGAVDREACRGTCWARACCSAACPWRCPRESRTTPARSRTPSSDRATTGCRPPAHMKNPHPTPHPPSTQAIHTERRCAKSSLSWAMSTANMRSTVMAILRIIRCISVYHGAQRMRPSGCMACTEKPKQGQKVRLAPRQQPLGDGRLQQRPQMWRDAHKLASGQEPLLG